MSETLTTERLHLRPISLEDADALFAVYSDPRAMRFMPTPPHRSAEETRAGLAQEMSLPGAHGWAICLKADERPVGYVNFLGATPIPGMGYILHPDDWGRGIVPEACRAVLAYGFERLGYDRVELWIDEENAASIRVAQKLGFKLRGQLPLKYHHQSVHHLMLVFGRLAGEEDLAARFIQVEPVFNVQDVLKTANYYRDLLGFQITFLYGSPPTYAGVTGSQWTGSRAAIHFSQVPANQVSGESMWLRILVDTGLDRLFDTYRRRGVTIISEPASRPWGRRDFSIRDCDGHILRFETNE